MSSTPEEQPAEGLRERKKRERKQALRTAAIELALEKGFDNVTIEDICDRCGVSRRTFFNYYSTKEEALLGRADTVFDDEDQPAIAEFEAGGPEGRLIADLAHLLTSVVRTRLNKREEMHQYHRILQQDPSLMQVQMSRMGNNERLFREMIQRRLDGRPAGTDTLGAPAEDTLGAPADGTVGAPAERDPGAASALKSASECHADEGEPVSTRAETLAALAMMAIRATFIRLRRVEGDPGVVIDELFTELRSIFKEESA
ncbi:MULTISPECIES: TetR/AcrR family transcriptional regulator [unclassified Brevibacterium]|uniref:TetR/AcrR family transcriptional regulator n=1 Tax=unclassified Brevibacterium TaxID=2614124 RepID=UPI001E3E1C6B|nr:MULTISPECIES: TetR/AcrR family transcriptional regulator [unclassified Brevibacterium]MCD1284411.1 TetR family transcriptional regulator [Brevibacterium sp. CCUG 69071]MDK8435976.1 TetR/AcrR family transcriptional regulator [Brevibacterium sp. H-BE7]